MGGRGRTPLPGRGTRAQLREEAAGPAGHARRRGRWRGRRCAERCNFAKNHGRGEEPEAQDKVVQMTPLAVVPVSVGVGAFCCGWEVGGGGGVGRRGADGHRGSLVRVTGVV